MFKFRKFRYLDPDDPGGTGTDDAPIAEEAEFNFGDAVSGIAAEIAERETTLPLVEETAPLEEPAPIEEKPAKTAPKTWLAGPAAKFSTLEPEVQDEILRREEDFYKGIEGYKEDAGLGKSLKSALSPYMPILQHYGIDPMQQIGSLLNAHYTLAFGSPEQKQALFQSIVKDYNLSGEGFDNPAEPGYIDPNVSALQKEIAVLKSQLHAVSTGVTEDRREKVRKEVDAFASDPSHEFFDQVTDRIQTIMRADRKLTLSEAYEQAIWADATTRAVLLQRQAETAEADRARREKEHAQKAAALVANNVKPRQKSASATTPTGSMDDTMKETLAAILAREK